LAIRNEYDWVKNNIPKAPCKLFNFGCRVDETVEYFLKEGYSIVGVDLIEDEHLKLLTTKFEDHFKFYQGNFFKMDFKEKFKCIYAISTIEHCGLAWYRPTVQTKDADGPAKALKKLYEMLVPGGYLLITVPYGKAYPQRPAQWRVYQRKSLYELLKGYNHAVEFFGCATRWCSNKKGGFPLTQDKAEDYFAAACIKIVKEAA